MKIHYDARALAEVVRVRSIKRRSGPPTENFPKWLLYIRLIYMNTHRLFSLSSTSQNPNKSLSRFKSALPKREKQKRRRRWEGNFFLTAEARLAQLEALFPPSEELKTNKHDESNILFRAKNRVEWTIHHMRRSTHIPKSEPKSFSKRCWLWVLVQSGSSIYRARSPSQNLGRFILLPLSGLGSTESHITMTN